MINKTKIVELLWFVAIVAIFFVSIQMIQSGELQERVASFGIFAPLVIIILKIATLVVAPLGGTPIYLLSGALFGNLNGFIIAFIGDVLGSAACFWISRKYGERVVRTLVGEKFFRETQRFLSLLSNTKSFLKARVALISIPELFAYAAGLSRVRFLKFIWIHSLFMVPIALIGVFFGSQLAILTSRHSIFAFLVMAVVVLGGFAMFWKDYEKTEGM